MSRFNRYLDSKFHGCMVIGHRDDPGRARRIMVYAMPGDYEHVGLFDGVDAWATEAKGDDAKMMLRVQAGEVFETELGQHRNRFADGTYVYGALMARLSGISAPPGARRERRVAEPLPEPSAPPTAVKRERKVAGIATEYIPPGAAVTVTVMPDGTPLVAVRRARRVV